MRNTPFSFDLSDRFLKKQSHALNIGGPKLRSPLAMPMLGEQSSFYVLLLFNLAYWKKCLLIENSAYILSEFALLRCTIA